MNRNAILSTVGLTSYRSPIVELRRLFPPEQAKVLLQLETAGPTGGSKDRVVCFMLDAAIELGLVASNSRIVEASSGAAGFALAAATAMRGLRLTLFAPEGSHADRLETFRALGTKLEFTPKRKGMSGALREAQKAASEPNVWSPNLFDNPANPGAHEVTTGPEIWNATQGRIDTFVAGVGSGGTFTGIGRYLRRRRSGIELVAVEPKECAILSGGKPGAHGIVGLGPGFVSNVFDRNLPTNIETVTTEEAALWSRKLAETEGLVCGISTGANLAAVSRIVAKRENREKTIVSIAFSSSLSHY